MCIVKSDKFKSQIMREKNDDKVMWTLLDKNSNQLWIQIYCKHSFKGCPK